MKSTGAGRSHDDDATPLAPIKARIRRSLADQRPDLTGSEVDARLDAAIQRGLEDSAAGRVKPAAEVFDRLEAKYQATAETTNPQTGQALVDALARPELADVEFSRVSFTAEVRPCDPQISD